MGAAGLHSEYEVTCYGAAGLLQGGTYYLLVFLD